MNLSERALLVSSIEFSKNTLHPPHNFDRIAGDSMIADENKGMWEVFKPVLQRYVWPQGGLLAGGVIAGVIAAACAGFGLPVMSQSVFPVVFGETEAPAAVEAWLQAHVQPENRDMVTLWGAALLIPVVMFLRGIATYYNTYLLTKAGMRALTGLRCDLFARLQWLSFSFHDRHQRGALMTAVVQYTQMVQQGLVNVLNDLVIQPLTLIAAVSYLAYAALTQHETAILLGNLIISTACVPLVRFVGKHMVKQLRKALAGMDIITSTVEETFSAQREVRAFNLQRRQSELLRGYIRNFNRILIKISAWQQSVTPSVEIVSALALSYALYQGCSDGLTLEQFTAIAMAFYFCYTPIKSLGMVANQCQLLKVGIQGINRIIEAKDETPEPAEPTPLPAPAGAVDFEGVTFGYNEEATVLHDVSVHVPAGQVVALVGPSGSGKTTFINLICRFYDVNSGSVKIDGVDVRNISRKDRTDAIGLVSQFSALFRDSIYENILVGKPGSKRDAVLLAGKRARVDEFAEGMEDGYDHVLTEGSGGLSGGQRQRVSIARAFLKNAPILILDEATSALDMKSEAAIQSSLEDLAAGHTTFIIAHRFSTIRMAQRILVFEEGRIVADGAHDDLYESCVLYRHLYDEQVRQANEGKEMAE